MFWTRPKCCECGKREGPGRKLVPYAKRGKKLIFVCEPCYYFKGYQGFLIAPSPK